MADRERVIESYFGKWGGFFVPDPMTPGLDDFASLCEAKIADAGFASQVENLAEKFAGDSVTLHPVEGWETLYSVKSTVLYYVAAGYVLLAKASGRQLSVGAYSPLQANIAAGICRDLGVQLLLFLNVATGSDQKLVTSLEEMGAKVDVVTSRTLFDEPDMYAFQKFVAHADQFLWGTINTVTGAYPYPSMAAYFASLYTNKVLAAARKQAQGKPLTLAAPGYPGFAMAGLLSNGKIDHVTLSTYEPPADNEKEDVYLGAYTRVKIIGRTEFVLSPILVQAWEEKIVERAFTLAPFKFYGEKMVPGLVVVLEG